MTTTLHDILWPKQNLIFSSTLFWWPPASSCLQLEKFGEMITLHNKHSNNVNKHHTVSDIMYFMKIMKTFTTTRANTILDYSNPRIWMNKFARYQILFSIEFFKVIWREGLFSFIFGQFFFLAYLMIFKVENEWWFCPMINMYIFDRIKKCHLGNQKKWKKNISQKEMMSFHVKTYWFWTTFKLNFLSYILSKYQLNLEKKRDD